MDRARPSLRLPTAKPSPFLGVLVTSLWIVVGLLGVVGPERPAMGADAKKPRRLVFLEPDLKIGKVLPEGWSHLAIRSVPRLGTGDIDTLPGVAAETATLFHTNILLDVRPQRNADTGQTRYGLSRIGLAICVPVEGVDTVVRSTGPCATRDSLGLVVRQVIPRAEEQLARVRIVAKTPTMIVLTAPTIFKVGDKHTEVRLFYAMTVDPETGVPNTFLWLRPYDETSPNSKIFSAVPTRLLAPSLKFDCPLDVKADRLLGAIPVNWSFAMTKMPPGRHVPSTSEIKTWTTRPHRIQAEPEAFEAVLANDLALPKTHVAR